MKYEKPIITGQIDLEGQLGSGRPGRKKPKKPKKPKRGGRGSL